MLVPGQVTGPDTPVEINAGRPVTQLTVRNLGDRPIQVGSHYHFAEANPSLDLDRSSAWGKRLNIPAGTAVRFEPGVERLVSLVPIAGLRVVPGLAGRAGGPLDGSEAGGRPGEPREPRDGLPTAEGEPGTGPAGGTPTP